MYTFYIFGNVELKIILPLIEGHWSSKIQLLTFNNILSVLVLMLEMEPSGPNFSVHLWLVHNVDVILFTYKKRSKRSVEKHPFSQLRIAANCKKKCLDEVAGSVSIDIEDWHCSQVISCFAETNMKAKEKRGFHWLLKLFLQLSVQFGELWYREY